MTKEENISTLNEHLEHWKRLLSEKICDQSEGEKTIDALQNAIKALEQEPTDAVDRVTIKEYLYNLGMGIKVTATDAVDRQAVLDQTYLWSKDEFLRVTNPFDYLRKRINSLPPVTPQQKMGRWEYIKKEDSYKCSLCGFPCHKDNLGAIVTRYCAGCGAVMEV